MGAPKSWMRYLLELRQNAVVIVSVPTRGDLTVEVYGQTRQEAIDVLMLWERADLLYAVKVRELDVPDGVGDRRLAEELVAAGPAYFGEWPGRDDGADDLRDDDDSW